MNLQEFQNKIASGDIPTIVMVSAGILVLIIAFKIVKVILKIFFILAALALLAGAAWWHFQNH